MAVTVFNADFRKAQEQLAKHGYIQGPRGKKMNKEEYERFMNSPAMQSQARYDEACDARTSTRDKKRMQTDKSFKPKDSDWTARKAFEFDAQVDYYRALGIDEYATQEEVKKAYRRLSLIYHPDKTAGMDEDKAEEYQHIFIQINNAYLTLGDHPTRRQYDKKRDDNVVAEELWGLVQKKKAEAQFDAFNIMEEIKAQKPKDSKTVLVQVPVKLEKMFYGGLKTFEREVRRETLEGFVTDEKLFELFVPPLCKDTYGLVKKAVGDHHEKQKPDHLKFTFKAKKHPRVQREGVNLRLREQVKLPAGALDDPYTSGQVEGLSGRVLLFFGRNPFYSVHKHGSACIRVAVRGEGFGEEGSFRFEVEYPPGRPPAEKEAEAQPLLQEVGEGPRAPRPEPPKLAARRKRGLGKRMECFAELQAFGEPVLLATQPASSLQFFGNLGQPATCESSAGSTLRVCPKPMFVIVMSSTLGAKRMFRSQWAQIKQKMLPLVWLSFWMLVPPMRRLQPRSLDNTPAFEDEEVADAAEDAAVAGAEGGAPPSDFFISEQPQAAAEGGAPPSDFFISEQPQEESDVRRFLRRYKLEPPGGFPRPPSGDKAPEPPEEPQQEAAAASGAAESRAEAARRERNRSRGQPARASSEKSGERAAGFAVDGSAGTRWTSLYEDGQWLAVDLGEVCPLLRVEVQWERACAAEYRVEGSLDGEAWTSLASEVGRPGWVVTSLPGGCEARWVRVHGIRRATEFGFSIYHLDVYTPEEPARDAVSMPQASRTPAETAESVATADKSRPAWAAPEPVGLPVVMGPRDPAGDRSGKAAAAPKPSGRFKAWRLYPRQVERLPPRPRSVPEASPAAPATPWMRTGDVAWRHGDYWVAYRCFSEAAREAGFAEPVKGIDGQREQEEEEEEREGGDGGQDGQPAEKGAGGGGADDEEAESPLSDKTAAAMALARRADCLQKLDHIRTALADARSATQILPRWSQAWARVGVLEARAGNTREAWEALFSAVDLDAKDRSNIELLQKLKPDHKGDPGIAARSEKIVGNGLFKEKPSKAIAHYTSALAALRVPVGGPDNDPEKRQEDEVRLVAEIFSNRSAAFAKLGLWGPAVEDAERIVALPGRSSWIKGRVRLGTALLGAGRPEEAYSHFAMAAAALPDDAPADNPAKVGRETCLVLAGSWKSKLAQARQSRFWRDAQLPRGKTKVHVISDIHFDHPLAEEWVQRISRTKFQQDILIVAGDVAENLSTLRTCFRHLRSKFRRVFFTPGNHDLWIHTSEEKDITDSIEKLFRLLKVCDEVDVDTFPAAVCEGLVLVPLFSWYNAEYDTQDPFPSSRYCFDKYCKWPMDKDLQLWRYMMYLNHKFLESPWDSETITFSHFLPRPGLPFWKHVAGLAKAVGCPQLDIQVRQAGSKCHVFGHSHHKCNQVAEGVRYVQNPLGYKDEHAPDEALFCIFDGAKGGLVAERRHLTKAD